MSRNNRGQMRIVEAILTCLILVAGLSVSIHMSSVYTVMESGSMEKIAVNILNVLDDPKTMEIVVNDEIYWQPELKRLIESFLPPDTFYELRISSALTGSVLGEVANLVQGNTTLGIDSISERRTVTISLAQGKSEYLPLDVMLIMDVSGSMNDKLPGDTQTKLYGAKQAAKQFIDQLNASEDRIGISPFSTEARPLTPLTYDLQAVKTIIDNLAAYGWTDMGDGIGNANEEFSLNGRGDSTAWVMILLSDGMANRPYNETYARTYALEKAEAAAAMGIRIYTIGLGAKTAIDESLLKEIAALSSGTNYYYAPSADDLADIYMKIAQDLMFSVKYDVILLELTLMKPR